MSRGGIAWVLGRIEGPVDSGEGRVSRKGFVGSHDGVTVAHRGNGACDAVR